MTHNPEGSIEGTVNLFMVYSPLHCLCAEQIVEHFEPGATNIVFYLKREFGPLLRESLWDATQYLPWPRFEPVPGMFGRLRRTRSNLDVVAGFCKGAKRIVLHTTVIDTEAINYNINYLRKIFPGAEFSVRLFPDGWMNIRRHPLGPVKELLQYSRLIRRIACMDLHFYRFRGCRTGADDKLVDRIYVLPRFPHQYDPAKVVTLPLFARNDTGAERSNVLKRALVLGQPLIAYKRMTRESVAAVTQGISDYLLANGIEEIHYKSHPRDKTREYALDGYRELVINKPLEHHLAEHPYGIVIGVCSTGLLTGRMVLPEWCKVISYGINLMKFDNGKEQDNFIDIFGRLGVEIINAEAGSAAGAGF